MYIHKAKEIHDTSIVAACGATERTKIQRYSKDGVNLYRINCKPSKVGLAV